MSEKFLIADIGGTNARFALSTDLRDVHDIKIFPCKDYETFEEVIQLYLTHVEGGDTVRHAAIAIANPVTGDVIEMTNHHWSFSIKETQKNLGLETFLVLNDFEALAYAIPFLGEDEQMCIRPGTADPKAPIAIVGPGTGLGMAGLLPTATGWRALPTEGGHATAAAYTIIEDEVLKHIRHDMGHVSWERVLSGPGLEYIYRALCEIGNAENEGLTAAMITERALTDQHPFCLQVMNMYFEFLGTAAANQVLMLGARGGVFIGGGILPRFAEFFKTSGFSKRFTTKGRFGKYLEGVPVTLILETKLSLTGTRHALEQHLLAE